jgi:hypothetical protein
MLAALSTLTLIPLVVCVGVCVPILGLQLELAHRRELRHQRDLHVQAALLDEYESTIDAYRRAVALELTDLARVAMPGDS